ncbi:MAG: type II 3-dehydroquinate dehydratase [Chloroflexota bacterium]|jgi:3-dehydroquinate dehydratase-2|uniref:3-dehydroquinate dehydratase n=1 Tax=marine metagenome TaxID=408172 RepID=A0A382DQ91_9ZZZZ|nr:type II 3-dehydroquinate dehydratase [Chloroflexota bacterium]
MTKILVVHGAGINMRGKFQVEIFGTATMDDYSNQIREYASELGVEVDIFHSNIEGEVINKFYESHEEGFDAAIINPAGYSSGHPALAAAITQVSFPTIEVHISNPAARGGNSEIAPSCKGVITGFGLFGYSVAIQAILDMSD